MTAAIDTGTALTALNPGLPTVPKAADPSKIKAVSQQFEAVFVTQMLGEMFEGISTDGPFGGGQGESMFRSLLMDEYGKQIVSQGGFGLSDAIQRELLKTQETTH